jgi:hypothetical protein
MDATVSLEQGKAQNDIAPLPIYPGKQMLSKTAAGR